MPEDYVLVAEVKELLEEQADERDELRYEQQLALQHARAFADLSADDARDLYDDALEIDRVTPTTAGKIADLCPKTSEDVRAIFANERFNLEDDEVTKILDTVAQYV